MALSVGTGGGPVWLNNGVGGPPATILGRPVVISEKVENLGDQGDINFIDFSYYLIGDRQSMTVASSEHFRFQNGETSRSEEHTSQLQSIMRISYAVFCLQTK